MLKRNLLTSLLLYEKVRTTKNRAAVIAPQVDKLITYAKTHTPHVAIRHINKTVTDTNASKKIMEVFTKRYAKKASGLTRTVAAGFRIGDGAQIVDISLVEGEVVEIAAPQKKEKASKVTKTKKTQKPEDKKPAQSTSPTAQ